VPKLLPGGSMLPLSIFREEEDMNEPELQYTNKLLIKTGNAMKDAVSKRIYEKIKTELLFGSRIDKQVAFGGFRTQHFEHLKEFIEKQELMGNLVKMPRYETNYLIVYETTKTATQAPHFFIYDILSRKVIRRFLPLSPEFEVNW
jgi:hypothetical protein